MGLFHPLHTPVFWFKNVSGIVLLISVLFSVAKFHNLAKVFQKMEKKKHENLLIFRDVFRLFSKEK
jgi:hypothetical protein